MDQDDRIPPVTVDFSAAGPRLLIESCQAANQRAFLTAISLMGTVAAAAGAAKIHRDTHYEWMKDPDYEARFASARQTFGDRLRHEAIRRGMQGVKRRVMFQGKQCLDELADGTDVPMFDLEYSDGILLALLRANCEEFRDKVEVTGEGGGPVKIMAVRYPVRMENAQEWSEHFAKDAIEAVATEEDD